MRTIRAIAFAVLCAAVPKAQQPSSDVGMGVFPFLVGNMDARAAQVADDCVRNGIDTIYVSVFRATGPRTGDLWITDRAGTWNGAWGPIRPTGAGIDLVALCREAHARNLRVVGVLKCFADTVQPTDAAHRQYLLDVVGYLVDSFDQGKPVYDLDGLALDYVRFVGNGTGNDPRVVTNFVRDVKARIGALSLHAYLIANRYTFDGPNYNGQFASYSSVISGLASQFGQHWEQLAAHLDVLMPMCYTADGSIYSTYALHQAYVRQAAAYCRAACNIASYPTRRVQPVVKTYSSSGETTTPQTIEASITGALIGNANGYQAFRYGTMQASWWPVMARWAVPGANFPVPELTATVRGLTQTVDPTASRDSDEPSGNLTVRFDWDDDGTFETPWLPNAATTRVLPSPAGGGPLGFQVRDSQAHVATTRRVMPGGRVVTLSTNTMSAAQGGQVQVRVDGGPGTAGASYLVLGTLSGTSPGTPWSNGLVVPLNLDGLSEALLMAANGPLLPGALGTLDGSGRATATFVAPPGLLTPISLRAISWSVVGADTSGQPWFVGDAAALVVLF